MPTLASRLRRLARVGENIGARRLQTGMSHLLNDFLFDIPDTIGPNAKLVVMKELVQERLVGLVKNRDLSQFVLKNGGVLRLLVFKCGSHPERSLRGWVGQR